MIALKNLTKIKEITLKMNKVLDLGGGRHPLPYATHVIDLSPYSQYKVNKDLPSQRLESLDPNFEPRFTNKTWLVHDVCEDKLPFEDNFFDFCFCSHLLEDIRDPINACKEIIRVSKAGYIETPSREREIFSKARFFKLKSFLGRMPQIGFYHHRWFVELIDNELTFTAKDGRIFSDDKRFIRRSELGRKMSDEESALSFFWKDDFKYTEKFLSEDMNELEEYKIQALKKLHSNK